MRDLLFIFLVNYFVIEANRVIKKITGNERCCGEMLGRWH